MLTPFKPQACRKIWLARTYFPEASPAVARNRLVRWIKKCVPLTQKLHELGYTPSQHYFSKQQVQTIIEYLGEP